MHFLGHSEGLQGTDPLSAAAVQQPRHLNGLVLPQQAAAVGTCFNEWTGGAAFTSAFGHLSIPMVRKTKENCFLTDGRKAIYILQLHQIIQWHKTSNVLLGDILPRSHALHLNKSGACAGAALASLEHSAEAGPRSAPARHYGGPGQRCSALSSTRHTLRAPPRPHAGATRGRRPHFAFASHGSFFS